MAWIRAVSGGGGSDVKIIKPSSLVSGVNTIETGVTIKQIFWRSYPNTNNDRAVGGFWNREQPTYGYRFYKTSATGFARDTLPVTSGSNSTIRSVSGTSFVVHIASGDFNQFSGFEFWIVY